MSTQQYLIDAATRHQVFMLRYANGRNKEAQQTLARLRRDIRARLASEPTEFRANRLEAMLLEIDALSAIAFGDISSQVQNMAYELARSESDFSAGLFNKASEAEFTLPSESSLLAAVDNKPMKIRKGAQGVSIQTALREFGSKKSRQIQQAIRDGLALGETTPEIAARIGTLMNTLQRRQVETLVRTAANHAANVAREEVYAANDELLEGYEWVSTLDSRTTLVCAGRDGKVYKPGQGPLPPAHWGCRSITVPKVSPEFSLGSAVTGERPAVGADGAEQVSTQSTYGGWLRRQPVEFQNEALGPERAKLFREGKVSIDKFTDPTGRVYTLRELEGMDNIALAES